MRVERPEQTTRKGGRCGTGFANGADQSLLDSCRPVQVLTCSDWDGSRLSIFGLCY